jgi:predicted unusual protein kinase regulating ubiquinone biosynthesis (AarF/ABC1/UbiB family)
MVGHISDKVKRNLRELMIAVATRDTKRLLKVYQDMDILLPGSDLTRIEQATIEVFNYIWGKTVQEMVRLSMAEKIEFATKYRDLMLTMPMQVPQDFIYLVRAVGILSGMCTGLDPNFNFWEPLSTYAQKLLTDQTQDNNLNFWLQEALSLGQSIISLPGKVQSLIEIVEQGEVQTRITATDEFRADLRRLERAITSTGTGVIFASLLIASTLLYINDERLPALIGYGLSAFVFLLYLIRK